MYTRRFVQDWFIAIPKGNANAHEQLSGQINWNIHTMAYYMAVK